MSWALIMWYGTSRNRLPASQSLCFWITEASSGIARAAG